MRPYRNIANSYKSPTKAFVDVLSITFREPITNLEYAVAIVPLKGVVVFDEICVPFNLTVILFPDCLRLTKHGTFIVGENVAEYVDIMFEYIAPSEIAKLIAPKSRIKFAKLAGVRAVLNAINIVYSGLYAAFEAMEIILTFAL